MEALSQPVPGLSHRSGQRQVTGHSLQAFLLAELVAMETHGLLTAVSNHGDLKPQDTPEEGM